VIKIECDKAHPPLKVESCGNWMTLVEEAANIVKGLTCSLLCGLPAEMHRSAADILKEAYALGYREGLKKLKEEEVTESETAD
jgi:hypothetical protein